MVWFSLERGGRGGRRARTWTDKGLTERIRARGKGGEVRRRRREMKVKRGGWEGREISGNKERGH